MSCSPSLGGGAGGGAGSGWRVLGSGAGRGAAFGGVGALKPNNN